MADIKDNQSVNGCFLVKEMTKSETKNGKPFLTIILLDKTGEITGRVWDNADRLENECSPGNYVAISGLVQSYRDNLQVNVKHLEAVRKEEVDLTLFMPSTPHDTGMMFTKLQNITEKINTEELKSLLKSFLSDKNFVNSFIKAPAAKNMHHAYLGGLLEHTLGVVKLAVKMTEVYPEIDHDLLVCGAVLHDIGKIEEFSYETPPFDYSDQGRLVGHMVLAIEMIQDKINSIKGFPEELVTRIKHLILSHHGCHEFGSPSLPMIREAFVLNFIDDLDAKMNYIDRLSNKIETSDYQWTPYQRTLERFLFVHGNLDHSIPETSDQEEAEKIGNMKNIQPSLW